MVGISRPKQACTIWLSLISSRGWAFTALHHSHLTVSIRIPTFTIMTDGILDNLISVDVDAATPWFQNGPSNLFYFALLQGFITVLFINELLSIVRSIIIPSSNTLSPNRIILWHMVEAWEDVGKFALRILRLSLRSRHDTRRTNNITNQDPLFSLNRLALRRIIFSLVIYMVLFGTELALVVTAVPTRRRRDVYDMSKLSWSNNHPVTVLNKRNTLHGSFSRVIPLNSAKNDVEFTRLPSVSLERTDYSDFFSGGYGIDERNLPLFDGTIINCTWHELWRVKCRTRTMNRFYQYKLRLDVSTEDSSQFFVPTSRFSVLPPNTNTAQTYAKAIRDQIRIPIISHIATNTSFLLRASRIPAENTTLQNGDKVLTHDALATLFFSTIHIEQAPQNELYFEREEGTRDEELRHVHGFIATSQRPYLPLYGIIALYLLAQLISVSLQVYRRKWPHHLELRLLAEICEGDHDVPFENMDLRELRMDSWLDNTGKAVHVGFLPVHLLQRIHDYIRWTNKISTVPPVFNATDNSNKACDQIYEHHIVWSFHMRQISWFTKLICWYGSRQDNMRMFFLPK